MAIDSKNAVLRSVVRLDSNQWKSERALTKQNSLVTAAAAASTGSVYFFLRVPSRARIHGGTVISTGTPAMSIGLRAGPGATFAVNNTALAPARTLTANTAVPLIADITRIGLMAWELAGLTADPDGAIDLIAVLTGDFTAGGPILFTTDYSVD